MPHTVNWEIFNGNKFLRLAESTKNLCNSLSNVAIPQAIHMPCINIHYAGHYQLEMVFVSAYLRLQWVTHFMDLTAFSCSPNKEVYVANNHLIGDTCTLISTWQNLHAKILSWGTLENLFTQKFNT